MSDAEIKSDLTKLLSAVTELDKKVDIHITRSESTDEKVGNHEKRLNSHSKRLKKVEQKVGINQIKADTNEWFVRLVIATSASGLTAFIIKVLLS